MTPRAIIKAASEKRAITFRGSQFPAAFLVGMPFNYVMHRLPEIKLYVPKSKTKKTK